MPVTCDVFVGEREGEEEGERGGEGEGEREGEEEGEREGEGEGERGGEGEGGGERCIVHCTCHRKHAHVTGNYMYM